MGIHALTLDAYGTLLHLDRPSERLPEELRLLGAAIPLPVVTRALQVEMRFYRAHHLQGRDAESLRSLRRLCAGVLFDGLAQAGYPIRPPHDGGVTALMNAFRFRLYEDVLPLLDWCAGRGLPVGIVSNWDISLGDTLQALCGGRRFECLIVSAREGIAKPDPALFRRAAQLLHLGAEELLHIGDEPEGDLEAARKAGCRSARIVRDGNPPGAAATTIRTLTEIPALLGGLARPDAAICAGISDGPTS
jgi:FMN phosphatase YigB (HAD superfamily)